MAGRNGRKSYTRATQGVYGYTIRGRAGRIAYVGISNDPHRRAEQHGMDGKRGKLRVETPAMSRSEARQWETKRLDTYRRNHSGKNPRHNKTRSGGWKS